MGLKIDNIRERFDSDFHPQNKACNNDVPIRIFQRTEEDILRYKIIGHKKEETPTSRLCSNMPKEFDTYLRYVKVLKLQHNIWVPRLPIPIIFHCHYKSSPPSQESDHVWVTREPRTRKTSTIIFYHHYLIFRP